LIISNLDETSHTNYNSHKSQSNSRFLDVSYIIDS
jgi:hypothetical protein